MPFACIMPTVYCSLQETASTLFLCLSSKHTARASSTKQTGHTPRRQNECLFTADDSMSAIAAQRHCAGWHRLTSRSQAHSLGRVERRALGQQATVIHAERLLTKIMHSYPWKCFGIDGLLPRSTRCTCRLPSNPHGLCYVRRNDEFDGATER